MNKDTLLKKKLAIEQRYTELNDEIKRLEGEHRAIVDLLENGNKPKRLKKVEAEDAQDQQ